MSKWTVRQLNGWSIGYLSLFYSDKVMRLRCQLERSAGSDILLMVFVDVLANQKRYAILKVGQVYVQTNSTPYEPRPHTTSPLAPSNLELIDAIV